MPTDAAPHLRKIQSIKRHVASPTKSPNVPFVPPSIECAECLPQVLTVCSLFCVFMLWSRSGCDSRLASSCVALAWFKLWRVCVSLSAMRFAAFLGLIAFPRVPTLRHVFHVQVLEAARKTR